MGEILLQYPRVVLEKRFLSEAEVLGLLNLAEGKYTRAGVVSNETGETVIDAHRTGEYAMLGPSPDAMTKAIEERIANVTGTRIVQGEGIQIIRYGKGDEYKPHYDWFDPSAQNSIKQLKLGGQRIATVILYLKMPEEGGETEFTEIKPPLKVKPESGDALFFWNLDAYGNGEVLATHAGRPPIKGDKIIATRWLRQRASDGTEEPEEVLKKAEEKAKVETAMNAAKKAQQDLNKAMQEEMNSRAKRCHDRIMVILKEERCKLWGNPQVALDQQGVLRIGATVEVDAMPDNVGTGPGGLPAIEVPR